MTTTKETRYVLCDGEFYLNLMTGYPYERARRKDISQAMHYYSREFAEQDLDSYRRENPGIPVDIVVRKLEITYKVH